MATIQLLLVEDDRDDIFFLKDALNNNGIPYEMKEIMEGDGVLPYLNNCFTLPDVIILDLNLPRVQGRDVLKELKKAEKLKNIPVVVLTTSASPEDMKYCTLMGVKKFITKPTSLSDYEKIVDIIIAVCKTGEKSSSFKSK